MTTRIDASMVFLRLELLPEIGGLADGDDAVLADRYRAIGDDLPILVEREQSAVLDQDIDTICHSCASTRWMVHSPLPWSPALSDRRERRRNQYAAFHFHDDVGRLLEIVLPFRIGSKLCAPPLALGQRFVSPQWTI